MADVISEREEEAGEQVFTLWHRTVFTVLTVQFSVKLLLTGQCSVKLLLKVQCNVRYYCVECRKTTAGGGSEQVYQSTEYSVQSTVYNVQCSVHCIECRENTAGGGSEQVYQ